MKRIQNEIPDHKYWGPDSEIQRGSLTGRVRERGREKYESLSCFREEENPR